MKMLVALDSSKNSDQLLNLIAERSWSENSQLKLVTAVGITGHWETDQMNLAQVERIMKQRVESLKSRLTDKIDVIGEVVEGEAAHVINEEARNWHCDQLIIGSHGDTGIRRTGLGEIAGRIVNQAPCSVEVLKIRPPVKTKKRESAAKIRKENEADIGDEQC